ncbi:hypothetical protein BHM03_00026122, partial [Ensete ventricosum]
QIWERNLRLRGQSRRRCGGATTAECSRRMKGVSRRGLRRRREWLAGSVLWKQRVEMREGEAGEDVDRGGNGAVGQRWRAEAEIQKSQPRERRPCRICAVEAADGDEARAAARAGEGCGNDRWRVEPKSEATTWLRPPACDGSNTDGCVRASGLQLGVLNLGLYLTALGTGGLKSSISGFSSDQFDETDGVLRNCEQMQVTYQVMSACACL